MKKASKIAVVVGAGLMYASLITLYQPLGIAAMGLWSFCFAYDKEFRRKF